MIGIFALVASWRPEWLVVVVIADAFVSAFALTDHDRWPW